MAHTSTPLPIINQCISASYVKYLSHLHTQGLEFSVKVKEITKFEKLTYLKINVVELDETITNVYTNTK